MMEQHQGTLPKSTEIVNPTSERNIISIVFKNNEKLIDVEGDEIFPEHFGIPANKYIYMAMMYLYSKKQTITPMAIIEVLSDKTAKHAVEEIGGLEYLTILESSNVHDGNLKIFCAKVKQAYTRRMLYSICEDTQAFVLSDSSEVMNPSELIGEVEQRLSDLSVNTSNTSDVYKMGDDTESVLKQRAETPDTVPGLEVGWPQLDRATGGGQESDLIIVVAESKTGKSVTLTNWATKFGIIDQIPVLYIDTEMSPRNQEDRILANLTGIPYNEIISGMYVVDTVNGTADEKVARIKDAQKQLKLGCYYHIYMPQFTIESVTALARKFKLQFGIQALFFDYIKIPSSQGNSMRQMQEYQMLGFFTSGLKDIAGTLKIPVYTAAQTNRANLGETDKDASSIGGSYRILQLATKLMFLTNKSNEQIAKEGRQNGNQVMLIKYQRNGESDCDGINIDFNKPILRQVEV